MPEGQRWPSRPKCAAARAASPENMSCPSERSSRSSNILKEVPRGWWITATTAVPSSASCLSSATTCCAWKASRPEVGSSRKSRLGLPMSSQPMESRLRSPPEMPRRLASPTIVSAALTSESLLSRLSTTARFSSSDTLDGSRSRAANMSVSRTVICV